MRTLNRIHNPAHQARIFQTEIFWPVLESIYAGKLEIMEMDGAENELLKKLIDRRSLIDIDEHMTRQRELAARREEKRAEIERKWNLIQAGCSFIAMILNDGGGAQEQLTPHEVYRTLVQGEQVASPVFEAHFS